LYSKKNTIYNKMTEEQTKNLKVLMNQKCPDKIEWEGKIYPTINRFKEHTVRKILILIPPALDMCESIGINIRVTGEVTRRIIIYPPKYTIEYKISPIGLPLDIEGTIIYNGSIYAKIPNSIPIISENDYDLIRNYKPEDIMYLEYREKPEDDILYPGDRVVYHPLPHKTRIIHKSYINMIGQSMSGTITNAYSRDKLYVKYDNNYIGGVYTRDDLRLIKRGINGKYAEHKYIDIIKITPHIYNLIRTYCMLWRNRHGGGYALCFITGTNKDDIITNAIEIPASGGCEQMPTLSQQHLDKAQIQLIKHNLTPFNFIRIGMNMPFPAALSTISAYNSSMIWIDICNNSSFTMLGIQQNYRTNSLHRCGVAIINPKWRGGEKNGKKKDDNCEFSTVSKTTQG